MAFNLEDLTSRQRRLLDLWFPTMEVVADHSWGLVSTTVLEVTSGGDRFIVKAAGDADHHIARETRAHRLWLRPWTSLGRAPELVHADLNAKIPATRYQPGRLVLGSDAAQNTDTYRQAASSSAFCTVSSEPASPTTGTRTTRTRSRLPGSTSRTGLLPLSSSTCGRRSRPGPPDRLPDPGPSSRMSE